MVIFLYNLFIFVWIQNGCLPSTVFALDASNSVIELVVYHWNLCLAEIEGSYLSKIIPYNETTIRNYLNITLFTIFTLNILRHLISLP